jgi:hypothetical protein
VIISVTLFDNNDAVIVVLPSRLIFAIQRVLLIRIAGRYASSIYASWARPRREAAWLTGQARGWPD